MEPLSETGTGNVKRHQTPTPFPAHTEPYSSLSVSRCHVIAGIALNHAVESYIASNGIYRCLACTTSPEMLIQAIATVRGLALVYETPALIRGGACTKVSLRGGLAHA